MLHSLWTWKRLGRCQKAWSMPSGVLRRCCFQWNVPMGRLVWVTPVWSGVCGRCEKGSWKGGEFRLGSSFNIDSMSLHLILWHDSIEAHWKWSISGIQGVQQSLLSELKERNAELVSIAAVAIATLLHMSIANAFKFLVWIYCFARYHGVYCIRMHLDWLSKDRRI